MSELDKAIAIISAASGADATAVAEQLKSDDAATTIATALFDDKFKEQRDQGDQRATKKTRQDVEKAFKAAGVEDASFSDLPAAIGKLQAVAAEGAGKTITDEQALQHPAVVKERNTLKAGQQQAIDAARQEERQALSEREKAFTKQQVDSAVRKEAERLVTELNPNFSVDPARAAKQRERLIDDLIGQGGYQVGEGGAIQLVDEHGNLLDGKLGKPAQFADRVRDYADSFYGLPESRPREIPAAGQPAPAATGIKTQEEYDAAYIKSQADSAALDKLEADYPQFSK